MKNKYTIHLLTLSIYVTIYLLLYLLMVHAFEVDVLFYASLKIAFIATVVLFFVMKLFFKASQSDTYFAYSNLLICFLCGYIISISLPTVLDRSLSFYILQKLDQRKGVRLDSFEYIFSTEYIREHKLVDIRITEQLNSGTIYIENGCVRLTQKGKVLSDFANIFRLNFLPKKRLIIDRYTDELIDPFSRSDKLPDYLCS